MKDLNYYLRLPYTVILRPDEQGDLVARIDELPGCSAHGKSPAEALEALEEAKGLWITDCIEAGDTVPEPAKEEALPSGKWVQRVPRSLHRKLAGLAKREGVSLNHLVTSILAEAVGIRNQRPGLSTNVYLAEQNHPGWEEDVSAPDAFAGPPQYVGRIPSIADSLAAGSHPNPSNPSKVKFEVEPDAFKEETAHRIA